ncbi:hypothetical protein [Bartonella tribocorum]|nr:hypothetical protein [Bartonella tribocorum]
MMVPACFLPKKGETNKITTLHKRRRKMKLGHVKKGLYKEIVKSTFVPA